MAVSLKKITDTIAEAQRLYTEAAKLIEKSRGTLKIEQLDDLRARLALARSESDDLTRQINEAVGRAAS